MALYGPIWLYMALYNLYMALNSCIWLYMALCGPMWLYMALEPKPCTGDLFKHLWKSILTWLYTALYSIYGSIWLHMSLYGSIWPYMALYGSIWLYVALYGSIWLYIALGPKPCTGESFHLLCGDMFEGLRCQIQMALGPILWEFIFFLLDYLFIPSNFFVVTCSKG